MNTVDRLNLAQLEMHGVSLGLKRTYILRSDDGMTKQGSIRTSS